MRLIFSGKTKEFTPTLQDKFSAKLAKLSKFVERRGEREAHVMHQMERHLHKVEVTVNFYDHALVSEGADADLEIALHQAATKLESQVIKLRGRWRDTHRDAKSTRSSKEEWASTVPVVSDAAPKAVAKANGKLNGKATGKSNGKPVAAASPKIFKVSYGDDRKPMTVEEAILEMGSTSGYLVYRDADRDCLSVLVRRGDGHFDLIES